ncbi:MAG TPA: hypothetical protein VER55_10450 [Ardenticatenaceae bacterium]|nr:hypothetical protein [Ardenticatenaceae bacterium]
MKSMAFIHSADTTPAGTAARFRLRDSAKLGAVIGFKLSMLYGLSLVAVAAIFVALSLFDQPHSGVRTVAQAVISALFILLVGSVIAFVVGGVPGSLIGLVTAVVVSLLLARISRERPERSAQSLALGVDLAVVATLHIALLPVLRPQSEGATAWIFYAILLGFPSLIYIAASIKMAAKLQTGLGRWDAVGAGQDQAAEG